MAVLQCVFLCDILTLQPLKMTSHKYYICKVCLLHEFFRDTIMLPNPKILGHKACIYKARDQYASYDVLQTHQQLHRFHYKCRTCKVFYPLRVIFTCEQQLGLAICIKSCMINLYSSTHNLDKYDMKLKDYKPKVPQRQNSKVCLSLLYLLLKILMHFSISCYIA